MTAVPTTLDGVIRLLKQQIHSALSLDLSESEVRRIVEQTLNEERHEEPE